jgi:ribose transport system substrate-binding protein
MKIYQMLTLGALLLAGCSQPDTTAKTGETPATTDKPVSVAFVTNNASDFWTIARKGTEKAASELPGVTVEFKMPAEGTAAEQKQILDDLVAKGTQGIAISPVDPANSTDLLNEVSKKALVITQDSDAPNSDRDCYIGTDNVAAGRQAGEEIKKAIPGGGKIMVFVGKIDAQNAKERYQGIQEALKGSNVEIVDVRTDNADHLRAKSNVADTLVKYSDLACLVGLWSYNGPAILNAVKDAGKVGKIKIVCFDEEDETLAGIKDGSIDATVVQQPFEFGYQSVKTLVAAIRGDKTVIPASKTVIVDTLVVNKENVEEFTTKLNGLRGRS